MLADQFATRREPPPKPLHGEPRHFFERAGFFKKMRCGRNDLESLFAAKFRKRLAVPSQHRLVPFSDNQQRRRGHTSEHHLSHVGAAATADDCPDFFESLDRCDERRCSARARSEVSDSQSFRGWVLRKLVSCAEEPAGEKRNVKTHATGH
jgi:hypothetical protein